MGAELRIRDRDVVRAAEELASALHEDVEEMAARFLRERLEREREIAEKVRAAMELAREIRAHMREPASSDDHEALYGEDGLPDASEDNAAAIKAAFREPGSLRGEKATKLLHASRLVERIREELGSPLPAEDHNWLYDADGLPH